MRKRVVITGAGCVSALGSNLQTFEKNIFEGLCGIKYLADPSFEPCSVRIGALVKDCPTSSIDYDQKTLSRLDPFMIYGIKAGIEAIEASGLSKCLTLDRDRIGIFIGSGIGGLSTIEKQAYAFKKKGYKGVSPFFIPSTLANMISGHLAIKYRYHGPNLATATACTTGLHTILQAFDLIQNDYADAIIAGGAESSITPLGLSGFAASKALSAQNLSPQTASRPFDTARDGFVMADGGAAIVIEEYEHALRRGAPMLAEILGGGYSGDAFHMTQPHPQGYGAKLAMRVALQRSGCAASQIDALSPHATSTPIGDSLELEAIADIFGAHTQSLWVFPTKGMTGHLLGASGALESVICILALKLQSLPPAINLTSPQSPADRFRIPLQPHTKADLTYIMNNSFAFGGANASVIFKRI